MPAADPSNANPTGLDKRTLQQELNSIKLFHENYFQNILKNSEFKNLEELFSKISSTTSDGDSTATTSASQLFEKLSTANQISATAEFSKNILTQIDSELQNKNSLISKSYLYYAKGFLLNISTPEPEGSSKSGSGSSNKTPETCLQKSVKLDPTSVEAWNQLGEAYWRKNDLKQSLDCYEHAESYAEKYSEADICAETFRNLGSLLRQIPYSTNKERNEALEKSTGLTKKAVKLDINNGMNWYMLGNAHISKGRSEMSQANSAYERAKSLNQSCQFNAELNFNQAQIHLYFGRFASAIFNLKIVQMVEPGWSDSRVKMNSTVSYLKKVSDLVASQGKLKKKVLNGYKNKLDFGKNPNSGVVVASISSDGRDIIAFTVILMLPDDKGSDSKDVKFLALRITNLLKGGNILIGDKLEFSKQSTDKIQNFSLKLEDMKNGLEKFCDTTLETGLDFEFINIINPEKELLINGRVVSGELTSGMSICNSGSAN